MDLDNGFTIVREVFLLVEDSMTQIEIKNQMSVYNGLDLALKFIVTWKGRKAVPVQESLLQTGSFLAVSFVVVCLKRNLL